MRFIVLFTFKAKETDIKTTIYKRAVNQQYRLKLKASRYVFNEINQRFPTFPFTVRLPNCIVMLSDLLGLWMKLRESWVSLKWCPMDFWIPTLFFLKRLEKSWSSSKPRFSSRPRDLQQLPLAHAHLMQKASTNLLSLMSRQLLLMLRLRRRRRRLRRRQRQFKPLYPI